MARYRSQCRDERSVSLSIPEIFEFLRCCPTMTCLSFNDCEITFDLRERVSKLTIKLFVCFYQHDWNTPHTILFRNFFSL